MLKSIISYAAVRAATALLDLAQALNPEDEEPMGVAPNPPVVIPQKARDMIAPIRVTPPTTEAPTYLKGSLRARQAARKAPLDDPAPQHVRTGQHNDGG
jgi:hypothetical protein